MRALLTGLTEPVLDECRRTWRVGGTPVRAAVVVGAALMVVGIAHAVGFVLLGGAWQGPVAWRKPFAFGMSFGLTAITAAWITTRLAVGRRTRWSLLAPLSAAVCVEVAWVSVQRARGVPSHFNLSTPADELAFSLAGGGSVAVVVVVLTALTALSWWRPAAPPALASAVRSGLAVLLVAQAVGGVMIQRGIATQIAGGPASHAVPPAGDLKLSHAVAMHAVQVLPVLALWLLACPVPPRATRNLTRVASTGYALLAAATLVLAAQGRSVLDPPVPVSLMAVAGLSALGAVAAVAVAGAARAMPSAPLAGHVGGSGARAARLPGPRPDGSSMEWSEHRRRAGGDRR